MLSFFMTFSITMVVAASEAGEIDATPVISDSYQIGPGDQLNISVWKEDDLDLDVLVRPDGGVTFPLIGEIMAGGMTTKELSEIFAEKLKRYIPQPSITIRVLRTSSNKVYVIGKVIRPGEFVATGYLDVLQALTLAGGLTPYADSDEIKIIRRTDTGTVVKLFDYDEVVSGERLEMNIILKSGDTIVVP